MVNKDLRAWLSGDRGPGFLLIVATCACLAITMSVLGCGKKEEHKDEFPPQGEFVSTDTPWPKVKYNSGQVSINDRCAVDRNRLSKNVPPVYVNSNPVGFCSVRCANMFLLDPGKYLRSLNIKMKCPVDSGVDAVLSARHRAFVNYEAYFFATPENLRVFIETPYRYSGPVTDPVSGQRFVPAITSPRRTRGGRVFYFSSAAAAVEFDKRSADFDPLRLETLHSK